MLAVENAAIQFAGRSLFKNLSFVLSPKDRVSFVGPNGAGKSTLLKIIAGLSSPDEGRINQAKYLTVGYLPQEGIHAKGRSLFAEAESAFDDVIKLQEALDEAGEALGAHDTGSPEYAEALEVYGELQLRLEHHDLGGMKPRIETVLTGLGFHHDDFDKLTDEFSGGWQMRIALAKLLLKEPSVLLLDEPTNHLDLDSQLWLENYLREYNGAIVLISHDSAFLDALITRTFAFHAGRVEEYAGNYSFFLRESVARREQLEREYKNQQKEIQQAEQYINRFRAKARRASQAQSRLKQLEKIERIELGPSDDANISFRFPSPKRSGLVVAAVNDITKSYGDLTVIKNFEFTVSRGDRIAIVGVNGAGKSTFSRMLAGVEPPTSGSIKPGHGVATSYFAQNHADELDPSMTVLQTVEEAAPRGIELNLRTLLGCFLFRGDDVFKSVSVLSGGERSRLALARMLLQPSNFLILDEPTNHLDMKSQNVLQDALKNFDGTYAIVSHNRGFLDPITNKVLEFRPGGLPPKLYLGNLSDYLEKKARDEAEEARFQSPATTAAPSKSSATTAPSGVSRKEQRKREGQLRQQKSEKLKPLNTKLEEVEARIAEIEARRKEIEALLNDPEFFKDKDRIATTAAEYKESASTLENAYTEWSQISDEIERLEAEFIAALG
ncbi:MAG: ABC-F family ATP-binding cassette domain-containing protein [Verrucomicrobiota bacterium]